MAAKILVTGATGNVGAEIVKQLWSRGYAVRVADVDPVKVQEMFSNSVEFALFDFARPETFAPALAGIEKMYLMRPPAISDVRRFIHPAIDAAASAGVKHIVFLSLIGIEKTKSCPITR